MNETGRKLVSDGKRRGERIGTKEEGGGAMTHAREIGPVRGKCLPAGGGGAKNNGINGIRRRELESKTLQEGKGDIIGEFEKPHALTKLNCFGGCSGEHKN